MTLDQLKESKIVDYVAVWQRAAKVFNKPMVQFVIDIDFRAVAEHLEVTPEELFLAIAKETLKEEEN